MKYLRIFEEITGTTFSWVNDSKEKEPDYQQPNVFEEPEYDDEDWNEEELPKEEKYVSNEKGVCPACGGDDLNYEGHPEIQDDAVYYQWVCNKCNFVGLEYYTMVFDEQYTSEGDVIRVGDPINKESYDD